MVRFVLKVLPTQREARRAERAYHALRSSYYAPYVCVCVRLYLYLPGFLCVFVLFGLVRVFSNRVVDFVVSFLSLFINYTLCCGTNMYAIPYKL